MNKFITLCLILSSFSIMATAMAKGKKANKQDAKVEPIVQPNRAVPGIINVHAVGIGLGQTFLHGEFDANGADSITADLFYSYSASYSFDVIANIHYSEHKFQNRDVKLPGVAFSIKGKIFQFDSFAPFLMAGLGFYRPLTKRIMNSAVLESQGKLTFGSNIGVGADLRLNKHFVAGLLYHYHNPFDIKQDTGPKVEGYYSKLLMTLMYTF